MGFADVAVGFADGVLVGFTDVVVGFAVLVGAIETLAVDLVLEAGEPPVWTLTLYDETLKTALLPVNLQYLLAPCKLSHILTEG